jgi:TP901 family phage tail tape measure protein
MQKRIIDDTINLDIVIDGNQGQMELGKLEEESRKLNRQIKELNVQVSKSKDKDSQAHKSILANKKELNAQLDVNRKKQELIRKELGLQGLTYKQLASEQRRLSTLLNNSTYGSEQWKKLNAELLLVRNRMREVRGGAQQTGQALGQMANNVNKYFLMVSSIVAGFVGIVAGIKKAYMAYADFDDKVADVMKTTGLAKEQVVALNTELEKINTRSSQEELLNLARIAGKLGINASKDVLEFVNAADKINVALSEDLGGDAEEAIRQLGKIVDIFKLKDEFGMEQSLLKVGSAINSLGAASTANEPYLVEFSKRLAGVAPSVGISIQNVLGLAASLDQLGQTSEVSSTVISQILPKMFKDTATFAGIASMKLSDFTELLNTDANEALLRVLSGLKGNDEGFSKLVQSLGDIGLEGKRTISVLGVLANNTDLIRSQQAFANEEFEKGTSILEEFNVKNNTARASLDKAIKSIQKTWRELGQKLQPAISGVVSKGTALVRSLTTIVDFFLKYGRAIKVAVVALTSYIATVKIANSWTLIAAKAKAVWATVTGVFTGKINLATKAMAVFNKVSKANVIGAIVGLVMGLVSALSMLKPRYDEAASAQKALDEVAKDANKRLIEEKSQMESLLRIARDEKRTREERLAAIRKLNEISPEYLGNLSLETIHTDKAIAATKSYIEALQMKYKVQAAENKVVELEERMLDLAMGQGEASISWWKKAWNYIKSAGNYSQAQFGIWKDEAKKLGVTYQDLAKQIETLHGFIAENKQVLPTVTPVLEDQDDAADPGNKELTEEQKKEALRRLEELKKQAEAIRKTYDELYDDLAMVEMSEYQRSVELLERRMAKDRQVIEDAYAFKVISEEQYQDALDKLELDHFQKRSTLDEAEIDRLHALHEKEFELARQNEEKILALREQYGLVSEAEQLDRALEILFQHHEQGLMAEEDYLRARRELIKKHFDLVMVDAEKLTGAQALTNLDNWFGTELQKLVVANEAKLLADEDYMVKRNLLEQKYADARTEIMDLANQKSLEVTANMFGTLAGFFEEGSAEYKMFATFQVTLDTIQAAMSAYKSIIGIPVVGPVLAPVAAATAAAFGIAQVAKINATEVPQYLGGYYDVVGEQTGKRYQARYRGVPKTGLVNTPSLYLAGDDPHRLSEMIIAGPDLKHPVIANYAQAIMDIKANRQPWGRIPGEVQAGSPEPVRPANTSRQAIQPRAASTHDNRDVVALLDDIRTLLQQPTRARVVYSDLEEAQKKMDRIRKDVSRG